MKTLNIRYGFATNSSSSHSVIIMNDDSAVTSFNGDFGWDFFTLSDAPTKAMYMAAQLRSNLSQHMSQDLADAVVQSWCPSVPGPVYDVEYSGPASPQIDHQSVWSLPWDYETYCENRVAVSHSFFSDLTNYVLRPRVVILGGNDNDSDCHPLRHEGSDVLTQVPVESGKFICRKDYDWWTFFSRENGTRITFSLVENAEPPQKFESPLLVDLKITNFCDQGCSFCYQDSTPQGVHAPTSVIEHLAYNLAKMKVFEVAIGGGEPTQHPDFARILGYFRRAGVVPNFTTRSLQWIYGTTEKDAKIRESVIKHVGSFAYSVSTAEDVDAFIAALAVLNMPRVYGRLMAIHVIPELLNEEEYLKILEKAHGANLQVTLLGLKHTGRGQNVVASQPFDWLLRARELRAKWKCPRLAIDTSLARKSVVVLTDMDLEDGADQRFRNSGVTWFTDEGGRSMYIDAVSMTAAPSSYSEPSASVPLEMRSNLREIFERLPIER